MNWIWFGINVGVILACILYLILKKPKSLVFLLMSLLFYMINLAIVVLGRINAEWVFPSGELICFHNMQLSISYMRGINVLVLVMISTYYVIRSLKRKESN
jgi:hypothetical protein